MRRNPRLYINPRWRILLFTLLFRCVRPHPRTTLLTLILLLTILPATILYNLRNFSGGTGQSAALSTSNTPVSGTSFPTAAPIGSIPAVSSSGISYILPTNAPIGAQFCFHNPSTNAPLTVSTTMTTGTSATFVPSSTACFIMGNQAHWFVQ